MWNMCPLYAVHLLAMLIQVHNIQCIQLFTIFYHFWWHKDKQWTILWAHLKSFVSFCFFSSSKQNQSHANILAMRFDERQARKQLNVHFTNSLFSFPICSVVFLIFLISTKFVWSYIARMECDNVNLFIHDISTLIRSIAFIISRKSICALSPSLICLSQFRCHCRWLVCLNAHRDKLHAKFYKTEP